MPLLGFRKEFAPAVEDGSKRQTIRAYRKDHRDPKVGQILYLYTGLRTKQCRKLGESTCSAASPITLSGAGTIGGQAIVAVSGLGGASQCARSEHLARADGFESVAAMFAWFDQVHGLPFRGLLIRWGDLECLCGTLARAGATRGTCGHCGRAIRR